MSAHANSVAGSRDGMAAGFSDPVHDAQAAFRVVLDALSNPGTVQDFAELTGAPEPLGTAAATVVLTLADYETPVWLSPMLDLEPVRDFVRFHTGAPIVDAPGAATFAIIALGDELPRLDRLNFGSELYPDRSSTLVVEVEGFGKGKVLSGPGIRERAQFGIRGGDAALWPMVRENHALYPLGVDFIFTCKASIAGLPRSTRVEG